MIFRKRILAFIIDYIILAAAFSIICVILYIAEQVPMLSGSRLFYALYGILLLCVMVLFIAKDCYKGKSIGKKVEKLKVISSEGKKTTIFQLFIRNITIFIWPVEFILLLLNKEKLGDRLANTIVIEDT